MLKLDGITFIAYRIDAVDCYGTTLYAVMLIAADGREYSIGRLMRTRDGARNQKGISLPQTEVAA